MANISLFISLLAQRIFSYFFHDEKVTKNLVRTKLLPALPVSFGRSVPPVATSYGHSHHRRPAVLTCTPPENHTRTPHAVRIAEGFFVFAPGENFLYLD
jgi:hypothetical protein